MTTEATQSVGPNATATCHPSSTPPITRSERKVHEMAIELFKNSALFARDLILFPTRFFGAKAWNLPGALIRLPIFLYRKITGQSTRDLEFRGYQETTTQITPQELEQYIRYGCINAASFHLDDETWLQGFDNNSVRFAPLSRNELSPNNLPGNVSSYNDKCFYDIETGFKASIVEQDHQITVVFSALDSLNGVIWNSWGGPQVQERLDTLPWGDSIERQQLEQRKDEIIFEQRRAKSIQQRVAIASLAGGVPLAFQQADALVAQVKEKLAGHGKPIVLTGQCFGGGLATYAALRHELPARCFNTLPLGPGLQANISRQALERAEERIVHISATTDFISDNRLLNPLDWALTRMGFRTPANWGTHLMVPHAEEYKTSAQIHDFIVGSCMEYLGHTTRSKPDALREEVLNLREEI